MLGKHDNTSANKSLIVEMGNTRLNSSFNDHLHKNFFFRRLVYIIRYDFITPLTDLSLSETSIDFRRELGVGNFYAAM